MTENDKPFMCHISGCGQRFANHDHLTTHQQKHDLSLRFRPGESLLVDQTPTPTRFLRIGEKIGLFQELEEATSNPFDHDFKSATTELKSDSQLEAEEDDDDDGRSPVGFERNRGLASIPVAPPATLVNPDKPVPMATAPAHINTASALTKQKLLQTIQMKEQQKLLEQSIARQLGVGGQSELLAQALKNMMPSPDGSCMTLSSEPTFMEPTEVPARRRRGRKPDEEDPEVKRQRFLERNRAAASRCRAKKKVWMDGLEIRCKDLEQAKQNLAQEVDVLRSEVKQLKSILIAHKDCPLIVHQRAPPTSSVTNNSEGLETGAHSSSGGGMTLLDQLSTMTSMSALIDSPVPSVGSVVPNMHHRHQHPLNPSLLMANGLTQQPAPEVAKDVEISDELELELEEELH